MVRNAFRQRPGKAGSEGKGPLKVPLLTQQRSPQPSPQPSGSGPTRQQPSQGANPVVAGPPGDPVMRQQDSSSTRAPRNLPQLEVCPSATAWNAVPPAAAPMDVDGSPEVSASQPATAAMPFSQAPGGTSLLAVGQDVPVPGKELLQQGAEQVEAAAAQHAETGTPAAHATLAADDASNPPHGARGGGEEPALEAVAPPGSASAGEGAAAELDEPQQHSAAIQRRLSGFLSLLEHLPPSQAGTPHGSPALSQPPSPRLPFTQQPASQPQVMVGWHVGCRRACMQGGNSLRPAKIGGHCLSTAIASYSLCCLVSNQGLLACPLQLGASTGEERQRHSAAAVVGGAPTLHGAPSGEAARVRLSAPSLAAAMAPSMALDEQQLQEPQAPHSVPAAAGAQATSAAPMPAFAKQPDMEGSGQVRLGWHMDSCALSADSFALQASIGTIQQNADLCALIFFRRDVQSVRPSSWAPTSGAWWGRLAQPLEAPVQARPGPLIHGFPRQLTLMCNVRSKQCQDYLPVRCHLAHAAVCSGNGKQQ